MREPRAITVPIDGQDIGLLVRPLTVETTARLTALGVAPGPSVPETFGGPAGLSVVAQYVSVMGGRVEMDGQPVEMSGEALLDLYGARQDVLHDLYEAVRATAHLSDQERRDLTIATRFLWWLPTAVGSPWKETDSSCRKCIAASLCESRGCDGTKQSRPVWHDHRMTVKVCPVRSLTPAVQAVLVWVGACYGPQDGRFRRIALPADGGVDQQDAWLLEAMAHVANVRNTLISDGEQRPTPADEDDDG